MAHTMQYNEFRERQKQTPSPPPDTYFELRMAVNTFCAFLWTLFGDDCDYYKGMMEVRETLDLQEVHIIRDLFTADICRRITWAILCDGRSFFNTVLVKDQFMSTTPFRWPTSLVHKIVDDVRYARPISRPGFPTEWIVLPTQGKSTIGTGRNDRTVPADGGAAGQKRGGPQEKMEGTWEDKHHPKIVVMMADYITQCGTRVQLTEILDAANKRITDLPTFPEYVHNGRPFVCWVFILVRCTFRNCAFWRGHVTKEKIPDTFAEEVVAMLTPGVEYCSRTGEGSPGKKVRFDHN